MKRFEFVTLGYGVIVNNGNALRTFFPRTQKSWFMQDTKNAC